MKLRVKITKALLEEAKDCKNNAEDCVVACAFKRIMKNPICGFHTVRDQSTTADHLVLPQEATDLIIKFDGTPVNKRVNLPETSFDVFLSEEDLKHLDLSLIEKAECLELIND